MTAEETIAALRAELATAQETIAALTGQVATLLERVKELEGQRATTSRNSSKPPSSDGLTRVPRSLRGKSGKKQGGQPGHPGAHLQLVDAPDCVIERRPARCPTCAGPLAGAPEIGAERRQVVEIPPIRPLVTEYRGVRVQCPRCRTSVTGDFPAAVAAPVQYGPRARAVALALTHQPLLPYNRAQAVLGDMLGCAMTEGTLATLAQDAAERLGAIEAAIAAALRAGPLLHNDETGLTLHRDGGPLDQRRALSGACARHCVHSLTMVPCRIGSGVP